jgi:hypothetical protein
MSLAKSISDLYKKYKKQLAILVLIFFMYKIFKYYSNFYEGYSSYSQCSVYQNCAECVNNNDGITNDPCLWSATKGCSALYNENEGYSKTCPNPNLTPNPTTNLTPNPTSNLYVNPTTNLNPTVCENIKNCGNCVENTNNCFWGDRDQKCSSIRENGYGKICSGSETNPDPKCPKCQECPKLTLLRTPTFITQQ